MWLEKFNARLGFAALYADGSNGGMETVHGGYLVVSYTKEQKKDDMKAVCFVPAPVCVMCKRSAEFQDEFHVCDICQFLVELVANVQFKYESGWRFSFLVSAKEFKSKSDLFDKTMELSDKIMTHLGSKGLSYFFDTTAPSDKTLGEGYLPKTVATQRGPGMRIVYHHVVSKTSGMRRKLDRLSSTFPSVERVAVDCKNRLCFIYIHS